MLTPEQQQLQREAMAKVCAQSDVVITTAKLFGRKAPVIVTKEMVAQMKEVLRINTTWTICLQNRA